MRFGKIPGRCNFFGVAPVRFGYGLGMERFERFRLSVPAVPLSRGFLCVFSTASQRGRFRFRFRFLENGSGRSGSAFGPAKAVPAVPVSGSASVPGPP